MSAGQATIVAILAALLGLQGVSLVTRATRQPYHVWSGLLALVASAFTALGLWLFGMDRLVVVPAFGAMIVDGRAHVLLRVLLLLLPIGSAILIESARAARTRKAQPLLVLFGVVVGIVAAARVTPLSAPEETPVLLYGYDIRSPLLLCWTAICVVEWVLVILEVKSRPLAMWVGALVVAGMTLFAWNHPKELYFGHETGTLWRCLLVLGWAAAFAFGLRLAVLTIFRKAFAEGHPYRRRVLWAVCGCVGLASLALLILIVQAPSRDVAVAAAVTLGIVLCVLIVRVVGVDRRVRPTPGGTVPLPTEKAALPSTAMTTIGTPRLTRVFDLILLPTLLAMIGLSMDLFYFRTLAPAVDLAALAVTALVLIELTSEGPLRDAAPTLAAAIWGSNSIVRAEVARVVGGIRTVFGRVVAPFVRLTEGSWVSKTIGKIVAIVVVVVVIQEIPNRGRTLIYPFSSHSLSSDKAILGEVVSERVANTMADIAGKLGSDVLATASGNRFAMVSVGSANGLETALQDDSMMVGPVKIPVGAVLTPLRTPLQNLFGARIISGSVQQDSTGCFHLLVGASTGETWHISTAPKSNDSFDLGPKEEPAGSGPARDEGATATVVAGGAPAVLLVRSDNLAYRIVTSDPNWSRAGMTSMPKAFGEFREGLGSLRKYEAMAGYDDRVDELENAILHLNAAVARDPKFAVAHYRLGLALRSDNQPAAAIRAFTSALEVNPRFGEAKNALAATLFDFESFLQAPPAPLAGQAAENADLDKLHGAARARIVRAQQIWAGLINAPNEFPAAVDRGSAYLGLCRATMRADAYGYLSGARGVDRLRRFAEAYYLCAKADTIYSALPTAASQPIAATRAEIATEMGDALRFAGYTSGMSVMSTEVGCDGDSATVDETAQAHGVRWDVTVSRFEAAARPLYERAHSLAPDDPGVSCNAATSAMMLGNPRAMESFAGTVRAKVMLGEELRARGEQRRNGVWIRAALDRVDEALQLEPDDLDALNEYAYGFWVWRYYAPVSKSEDYERLGEKAERAARRAVRLASQGVSKGNRAMYESTLGEVLMALGRPHEAIDILEKAVSDAPKHRHFDEMRWDLARAYTCATYADGHDPTLAREEKCPGLLNKAALLYDEIRQREQTGEGDIYAHPMSLDPTRVTEACASALPNASTMTSYKSAEYEKTMALLVSTDDPESVVHVWGRGVNAMAAKDSDWRVLLGSEPTETHHQYFAQVLSRKDGKELSPVMSFRTHRGQDKNLILMKIDRRRGSEMAEAEGAVHVTSQQGPGGKVHN